MRHCDEVQHEGCRAGAIECCLRCANLRLATGGGARRTVSRPGRMPGPVLAASGAETPTGCPQPPRRMHGCMCPAVVPLGGVHALCAPSFQFASGPSELVQPLAYKVQIYIPPSSDGLWVLRTG